MNANRESICGDPAALAGYLYGECSPGERAALTAHLATCEPCRTDIEALRETREALTAWAAPDDAPGVRVAVEPPHTTRAGGWSWSAAPAWMQAAAAVFIFACGAAGAAVMNLDVRYDAAGVTVRTGWSARPTAAPVLDAAAVDARIRAVVQQASVETARPAPAAAVTGSTPAAPGAQPAAAAEVLRQVEQMLAASETRQQRELALRVSQVLRDVDSQHRSDMARIERTVSPVAGLRVEEIQEQRQMLNYLMRVSQTK